MTTDSLSHPQEAHADLCLPHVSCVSGQLEFRSHDALAQLYSRDLLRRVSTWPSHTRLYSHLFISPLSVVQLNVLCVQAACILGPTCFGIISKPQVPHLASRGEELVSLLCASTQVGGSDCMLWCNAFGILTWLCHLLVVSLGLTVPYLTLVTS